MLLMLEGFDHYNIKSQLSLKGWIGDAFSSGAGRFAYGPQSQSMNVILFNGVHKALPAPTTDLVVGFGFLVSHINKSTLFVVRDQTFANSVGFGITSDGHLFVNDGATTFTGTYTVVANTWYYAELKLDSGTAELHLDGVVDIGPVSGNFSNGWYIVEFEWGGGLGGHSLTVDDFYLCDLTGPTNNNFLGDIVVETLYPISDGTYHDWTPDSGSNHYSRVNELHIDELASYVSTTTTGDKDSYGIGSPTLEENAPICGVQLNLGIEKADAGTRTIKALVRQSGTDYLGPAEYIPTDWGFVSWLLDQDPSGSDWTATTVDSDEYGVSVTS